jgi:hypothetical protein
VRLLFGIVVVVAVLASGFAVATLVGEQGSNADARGRHAANASSELTPLDLGLVLGAGVVLLAFGVALTRAARNRANDASPESRDPSSVLPHV